MVIDGEERRDRQRPERTTLQRRVLNLLPALACAATFGYFVLDKSSEARTLLGSGRGLLVVAVIVIGYAVVAFALKRLVRWSWVPPIVLAGVVVALAAWTIRPYYVDETAELSLITGPVQDASELAAQPGVEAPLAETPPTEVPRVGVPATEAPPTAEAPTSAPTGEPPAPGALATSSTTGPPTAATASPPAVPPAPAQPSGPVRISTGNLAGIDHDASGTASLIRNSDGSLVLRFESFAIEGTPDPQLYLAEGDDVREPRGTHLGRMPGNRGQNLDFAVPAGTNAGTSWTVLVWCGRFAVPIANAVQVAT